MKRFRHSKSIILSKPLKSQSRLKQMTDFAKLFLIFEKRQGMILHENRLQMILINVHILFVFLFLFIYFFLGGGKQQNKKLSSAANYRWRFKG